MMAPTHVCDKTQERLFKPMPFGLFDPRDLKDLTLQPFSHESTLYLIKVMLRMHQIIYSGDVHFY